MPSVEGAFNLPFEEQLAFFRQKLSLPTATYDDIIGAAHDRAFVVAGAMKADLLADLRGAVDKAMSEGKSLQWFRKEFDAIVERRGWSGWTGEGSKAGTAWRTRTIFSTNLKAAHAAGRYAQLTQPEMMQARPFWRYVHRSTENPRHHHRAWGGMVLAADDPWWEIHYPPNGWGCNCLVEAINARELASLGKDELDTAPDSPLVEHVNRATGEVFKVPLGVQPGWDYAPGAATKASALAAQANKLERLEPALARLNVAELVASPLFARFVRGQVAGEFPVAALKAADQALLRAASPVVVLSQRSVLAHKAKHPDVTLADYRLLPQIIEGGEVWQVPGQAERLIFITLDGVRYRAALKRTRDGSKNYLVTLFRIAKGSAVPKGAVKVR